MDAEVEVLKTLVTSAAAIGTATAVIYTWVLSKTRPITWTLLGMTGLLWSFALLLWSQRYVLYYVDTITTDYVAVVRSIFLCVAFVGYMLFLLGTYRTGPICNNNKKK